MNKNIHYNLNEENLRNAFGDYHVKYDEMHWAETEQGLDALGLQRKNSITLRAKKLVMLCCLVVIGGGLVAFINYKSGKTNIKSISANAVQQNDQQPAISSAVDVSAMKIDSDFADLQMSRKTIPATIAISAPTETKTEEPVAVPENKTEVKKEDVTAKQQKDENSQVVVTDDAQKNISADNKETKKKKKKRRRHHQAEDGNAPAVHSSGEDDVIIGD
jgi:hypothetical protein